jgi:hypothetical protein
MIYALFDADGVLRQTMADGGSTPENDLTQPRYAGWSYDLVSDDDERIVAFNAAVTQTLKPAEPTKSELLVQINALMAKVEALP